MSDQAANLDTRTTLLDRLASDPESWNEFVALYRPLLEAYIGDCNRRHRLSLVEADRDDLLQEVLTKLLQELRKFRLDRTRGRFRSWVWSVTYHVVVSWI